MNASASVIFDHLGELADATRSRILLLLDPHELTVSELCTVTQLPQSTVSRHLKVLSDSGWITARAEGTSRFYTMARHELSDSARRLWGVVREQVAAAPVAAADRGRLEAALAARRAKSREFFSSSAGQWDKMRDELFGEQFLPAALAALAPGDSVVGDLGCGTGLVSATLAPFVSCVVAVDDSPAMLQAARERLQRFDNIELRRGELGALPIDDARLDVATLMLVLHHVPDPALAIRDVARALKPGGRIIVVDMLPHDRESYRHQMGHVWLGFAQDYLERMFAEAGFQNTRIVPLAPDPRATGPGLFVAIAQKEGESRNGNRDRSRAHSLPRTRHQALEAN